MCLIRFTLYFTTGEPTAAEGPDDGDPAAAGGADRLQVAGGRGEPVDEGAPPEGRRPRQVLAGQYPAKGAFTRSDSERQIFLAASSKLATCISCQ